MVEENTPRVALFNCSGCMANVGARSLEAAKEFCLEWFWLQQWDGKLPVWVMGCNQTLGMILNGPSTIK